MTSRTDLQLSRFDSSASLQVTSQRWETTRLSPPNQLWGANGVAFGPDGRLYVAQFLGGQISAVDTESGEVETVVPLDGPIQAPDDLAFGADGSMFITDLTPGRVWRRRPNGEFSLLANTLTAPNGITCVGDRLFVNEMCTNGRLLELFPDGADPAVLATDLAFGNAMQLGPDGLLYYPHMLTNEVWRVSPDGGKPELFVEGLPEPVAVRFDRTGLLVVLSRGAEGAIATVDLSTGARSTTATGIAGQDNAAFDQENRMLVSSFASGGVTAIDIGATARPIVARGFSGPFGITADTDGRMHVADHFRLAATTETLGAESGGVLISQIRGYVHGLVADQGLLHLTSQLGDVRTYDPASHTTRTRAQSLAEPSGIVHGTDGALIVAEAGAGRVLRIDQDDTLTVLVDGLDHPVDVALDAEQRCYVSDDGLGQVVRISGGRTEVVMDGLGVPQGITVHDDELFIIEIRHRRLRGISLTTGESRIDAENLPVGLPLGTTRVKPEGAPGTPCPPRQFAGLTTTPEGSLLLSANGEGTVLRLSPLPNT